MPVGKLRIRNICLSLILSVGVFAETPQEIDASALDHADSTVVKLDPFVVVASTMELRGYFGSGENRGKLKYIKVVSVAPGQAASVAGFKQGDRILKIAGLSIVGLTIDELTSMKFPSTKEGGSNLLRYTVSRHGSKAEIELVYIYSSKK